MLPQVDEDRQTVTVAAGVTQRALLDYLSGGHSCPARLLSTAWAALCSVRASSYS